MFNKNFQFSQAIDGFGLAFGRDGVVLTQAVAGGDNLYGEQTFGFQFVESRVERTFVDGDFLGGHFLYFPGHFVAVHPAIFFQEFQDDCRQTAFVKLGVVQNWTLDFGLRTNVKSFFTLWDLVTNIYHRF